jgi:hypothetical protein
VSTTLIDRTLPAARLSQLIIDADKDWLKYNITNFGPGGVDLYSLLTAHASRHLAGGADALSGIARSQLEYPTVDVNLEYLFAIGKAGWFNTIGEIYGLFTVDSFADLAIGAVAGSSGAAAGVGHGRTSYNNAYYNDVVPNNTAADHRLFKLVSGTWTTLATEAVDLATYVTYLLKLSCLGSTMKSYRTDMATAKLSATDTSLASGRFGVEGGRPDAGSAVMFGKLVAPGSPSPKVLSFYEVPIVGSGTLEDPFRAQLPELLEVPASAELDAYPPMLKRAIQANVGGRVNRLALSHSALIPTDPTTGKPLYSTCIVRVFEQPDRQPHLWKIAEVLARLETQTAIPVKKLDVDQAIRRAKEMDPKLSDFDFYAMPSPSDDEIRKYIEWRKATFGVETRYEDAKHYLESDKGWA